VVVITPDHNKHNTEAVERCTEELVASLLFHVRRMPVRSGT
jgi:hypothetical protein